MRSPSGPVRILSIDGGGIRGLIPALVLEKLGALIAEAQVGKKDDAGPLAQHFDLICGASTGAIIAVGTAGCQNPDEPLATPHALVHLYADEAGTVFAGDRSGMTRGLFGPKYRQEALAARYAQLCGDAKLSTAMTNLLIPAYDIERPGVHLFRGGPGVSTADREDFYLRDVLRAATAAPHLFPPARVTPVGRPELRTFVDGGVFASSPALHAYLEARQMFGADRDILLVSLGTGVDAEPLSFYEGRRRGAAAWLDPRAGVPLVQLFMHAQADGVHENLRRLIPDPGRYVRLNVHPVHRLPQFDDTSKSAIDSLFSAAQSLLEREESTLRAIVDHLLGA